MNLVPYKSWLADEANRRGCTPHTVAVDVCRGKYPWLIRRHINKRVVVVDMDSDRRNGEVTQCDCEERVIEKIKLRRATGLRKYGKTMERDDLSLVAWVQHAQEEAMDHCIYLEKIIEMLQSKEKQ